MVVALVVVVVMALVVLVVAMVVMLVELGLTMLVVVVVVVPGMSMTGVGKALDRALRKSIMLRRAAVGSACWLVWLVWLGIFREGKIFLM